MVPQLIKILTSYDLTLDSSLSSLAVFFVGFFYDSYLEEVGSPELPQSLDSLCLLFALCYFVKKSYQTNFSALTESMNFHQ